MFLDERGNACPQPVIDTKKALESEAVGAVIEVAVDNEPAVHNLSKLAEQNRWGFETLDSEEENTYLVRITKTVEEATEKEESGGAVVLMTSEFLGSGDDTLGSILVKGMMYALTESSQKPEKIILMNGGAKLSVQGAATLDDLKTLESQGVEIFTCGTCLQHFGLEKQLGVGEVTNMYSIADMLLKAKKVVRL